MAQTSPYDYKPIHIHCVLSINLRQVFVTLSFAWSHPKTSTSRDVPHSILPLPINFHPSPVHSAPPYLIKNLLECLIEEGSPACRKMGVFFLFRGYYRILGDLVLIKTTGRFLIACSQSEWKELLQGSPPREDAWTTTPILSIITFSAVAKRKLLTLCLYVSQQSAQHLTSPFFFFFRLPCMYVSGCLYMVNFMWANTNYINIPV